MIVCVCNRISSTEIEECLDNGQSIEEAILRLHIGEYCGLCLEYLKEKYPEEYND